MGISIFTALAELLSHELNFAYKKRFAKTLPLQNATAHTPKTEAGQISTFSIINSNEKVKQNNMEQNLIQKRDTAGRKVGL